MLDCPDPMRAWTLTIPLRGFLPQQHGLNSIFSWVVCGVRCFFSQIIFWVRFQKGQASRTSPWPPSNFWTDGQDCRAGSEHCCSWKCQAAKMGCRLRLGTWVFIASGVARVPPSNTRLFQGMSGKTLFSAINAAFLLQRVDIIL